MVREAFKNGDDPEGLLTWLGRRRPDRFDPKKVKFWRLLRRLKIALADQSRLCVLLRAAA